MNLERFENYKKYIKYLIIIIIFAIILLILKGCKGSYNELESNVQKSTLKYINENNVNITKETYIPLSDIDEVAGTEMCSKASGSIVSYKENKIQITPYLKCDNYESKIVNNKEKYASLIGDDVIVLNYGETFNDPGYTLKIEGKVEVTGEVSTYPGIYTLNYYVYDENEKYKETLERKVIVSKNDKTETVSGIKNKDYPTIILEGDSNIVLKVGEKYIDPGYKAIDYTDGRISREVKVNPTKIDTSRPGGPYDITYTVTNSKGRTTSVKRTITVVSQKSNLNISLENLSTEISNKTKIKITIAGSGYNYTLLPDNSITHNTSYIYEANYNKKYTFKIYDQYGNVYLKEIEVDNIDSTPPSGTCEALVSNALTEVKVDASDNKGISGYQYILDNEKTDILTENSYQSSKEAKRVSVSLVDIVGNTSTINCSVKKEEKKGLLISGTCGASDIYVNIKTCYGNTPIRDNVPLEEYLLSVIYGESNDYNPEFIKAFIIFARTYTLKRIGYGRNSTYSIKSCSSDQNWCDVDLGCYREQTVDMFNKCIEYAINVNPKYSAETCANRVTTYPGSKTVGKPTFYVTNPAWPSDKAKSAVAASNTSRWHGPLDQKTKEFYTQMLQETAGLVIKTSDGKLADVNYWECKDYSNEYTLCPTKAKDLANQGLKYNEIIAAYTTKYPNAKIECYKNS